MRMDALAWITIALGCLAVYDDLRRRVISNWVSVTALVAGLSLHTFRNGFAGTVTSLEGALLGFGLLLTCYILGGMGGGDVKLMAGFGALLGPSGVLLAAVVGSSV